MAINSELLRGDIAAYHPVPPTGPEAAIALLADTRDLAVEIQWDGCSKR